MTAPAKDSLDHLWNQWKVVVDLYARKNVARHQIRGEMYRKLHRQLLETCLANTDEERSEFARMAADVVKPWTTLEAFNDAPAKILEDLWICCQAVDPKLEGTRSLKAGAKWTSTAIFGLLFLLVFAVTLIVIVVLGGHGNPGATAGIAGGVAEFLQTTKEFASSAAGRIRFWGMGILVAVLVSILAYVALKSPRQS